MPDRPDRGLFLSLQAIRRQLAAMPQELYLVRLIHHRNPTGNIHYFTTAHFHCPDELAEEIRLAGFTQAEVLAQVRHGNRDFRLF